MSVHYGCSYRQDVIESSCSVASGSCICKIKWLEDLKDENPWQNGKPRITVEYEPKAGFLLATKLEWNRQRQAMSSQTFLGRS